MTVGILPYVKIKKLNRDANSATSVCSNTLMLTVNPAKSRRKVVERISSLIEGIKTFGFQYSKVQSRRNRRRFYGRAHNLWDQVALSVSRKARYTTVKKRERKGPSQGVIQKCEPQEANPCAPKVEDPTQEETLQHVRRRPQRSKGFGEECLQAQ